MKIPENKFLFLLVLSIVVFGLFLISDKYNTENENVYQIVEPEAYGTKYSDLSGVYDPRDNIAQFEGKEVVVPNLAMVTEQTQVLAAVSEDKWIEVDLSEQKLKAWEGDSLFLETSISSGLPWYPTPTGEFKIWIKLRATKMEGGSGKYYYYLPNVPYVMFFENDKVPGWKGYGLHGTYWHNDFGTPRSHGCVNLPTEIAKELYYWVDPALPLGKNMVRSTEGNPGTRIVIHE